MRILLIEDNEAISDNIKKILSSENTDFIITQRFDGEEGLKEFLLNKYDIVLLDIMIPKIDGITVCKRIRARSEVPIIMMTSKGEDDDKILGLESGADDYIVKPFKVRELQARIKSITKRYKINEIVTFLDIEIDFSNKIVKKDSKQIDLKLKEFQTLDILYKKQTISRTDLIAEIWGNDNLFVDNNKLDVYIYSLRKKLGKNVIKTIKGFGYSLNNNPSVLN